MARSTGIDAAVEAAAYYGSKLYDVPQVPERCRACRYQRGADALDDDEADEQCAQCPYYGYRIDGCEVKEIFARLNGWI